MIQFIKILNNSDGHPTGITFNGESPFIHWFEGARSVNLWHYHRLLILGPEKIDVELEKNSIFTFYKPGKINDVNNIDNFLWDNMNECTSKSLSSVGAQYENTEQYIHQLLVLAKSSGEGEYIGTMTISGEECGDKFEHEYFVGIELFNENEQLGINLANMGIEIPEAIVKALYSSDLFEDYTDWVLINRKWRELLSNYMDIWACKGNYKSLINSLKWFEYGDLVELREVWKYGTNGGTKLIDKPISQWLTEKLAQESRYSSKTTYFALRHLSVDLNSKPEMIIEPEKTPDNPEFEVPLYSNKEYNCNPPTKCSHEICSKWEKEELRMKMTLLGSFFETYFMPIHLDLIRSVIEDIYFNVLAILTHGAYEIMYIQNSPNINDFEIAVGEDIWDSSVTVDLGTFNLDMVEVWGNSDIAVPFSSIDGPIVGVTLNPPAIYAEIIDNIPYIGSQENIFKQNYRGIGAIIPITIRLPEQISTGYIETNINGYHQRVELGDAKCIEKNGMYELSMNFLVQTDGEYYIFFNLAGRTIDGFYKTYTKRIDFNVQDNTNAVLTFFKLIFDSDKYKNKNPFDIESLGDQLNMFISDDDIMTFTSAGDLYPIYDYDKTIPASKISSFSYKQYIPIFDDAKNVMVDDQPRKLPLYVFHSSSDTGIPIDDIIEKFDIQPKLKIDDKIKDLISIIEENLECWCRVAIYDDGVRYIQIIGKKITIDIHADVFKKIEECFQTYFIRQIYIPEFHSLIQVYQSDEVPNIYPIVCTPMLYINNGEGTKKLEWTNNISEPAWTFKSENYQIILDQLNDNIIEPFIANPYAGMEIPHGYYTITFKYRWGKNMKTITSKSPFIAQYSTKNIDYRKYNSYTTSKISEFGSTLIKANI